MRNIGIDMGLTRRSFLFSLPALPALFKALAAPDIAGRFMAYMKPADITAFVRCSDELLRDSAFDAEALIKQEMMKGLLESLECELGVGGSNA